MELDAVLEVDVASRIWTQQRQWRSNTVSVGMKGGKGYITRGGDVVAAEVGTGRRRQSDLMNEEEG